MALTPSEQFEAGIAGLQQADISLLARILTDPDTVTVEQQRTVAQRLGLKNGFLSAAVNTFSDPVVWIAFLMSRRFPTMAWMKGTVPDRFVGAANNFTGFGKYVRPVETYFRGTTVPNLVSLKMHREAQVLEVGKQMLDKLHSRPNWKNETEVVSSLLEGQSHPRVTLELHKVAQDVRKGMDELWGFLAKTKKVTGSVEASGEISRAYASDWKPGEAPQYLRDYLPHIPLLGKEGLVEIDPKAAIRRLSKSKEVQTLLNLKGINVSDVWSPGLANRMTSSFTRYQDLLNNASGQVFNPRLFHRSRRGIALQSHQGQELWITNLDILLEKYISSVARTYSVNAPISPHERAMASVITERGVRVPTDEPIIVQVINEGLSFMGARTLDGVPLAVKRPVAGTRHMETVIDPSTVQPISFRALQHLVRAMTGRMDEGEAMYGSLFAAIGRTMDTVTGGLTRKQQTEVDAVLKAVQRNRAYRPAMNGITSFFYSTTLGLNPWSAFQNLLQPILTTAPSIGTGPTLTGIKEVWGKRMPLYARALRREMGIRRGASPNALHRVNEAAQAAFDEIFPELKRAGIRLDPRLFDIDPNSTTGFAQNKWFKTYDDFAKFLLQPFTHAELANQATTFYGAKEAMKMGLRTGEFELPRLPDGSPLVGAALDEALNFHAGNVVNATQFRPGPGSRSIWQGSVPAPFRQFTSFPIRALSFFTESTVRGAMTAKQLETASWFDRIIGGRNLGTLARTVLYGRLASIGARDALGIDLTNAVGLMAPFQTAPPSQMFAPFPLPPAAGITTGLISAATTRDLKRMQPMILPGIGEVPIPKALFPAGIEVSRVARVLNQWRPDMGGFVDDDERLMYRGNETDMIMGMLGIPLSKNRRVRHAVERTHALRGRMRQFRRDYAQAWTNRDVDQMNQIRANYSEAFPDFPPLNVTMRDLKRYHENARLPLLQRMFRTMGQTGRYLESEMYEVDPDILAPQQLIGGQPLPLAG